MNLVIIASPYSSNPSENRTYARDCMRDSLRRGEAPFASHLLYPLVLDDASPDERNRGMQASYQWMSVCDLVAFYLDRGWSDGMVKDLKIAITLERRITARLVGSKAIPMVQFLEVEEHIRHARQFLGVYHDPQ